MRAAGLSVAQAWRVLAEVPDPEVPAVSLCDLGIVRKVARVGEDLEVTLTPTYSGCPATEAIAASVRQALGRAGEARVVLRTQLSPAWSSDWISADGRDKLRRYGIAPPACASAAEEGWQPLRFQSAAPACPQCGSGRSRRLSQFGSSACKALYRCEACLEPFEYFKPI